jgi:hypothetical protein
VYVDDLVRNMFCKGMTPRRGSHPGTYHPIDRGPVCSTAIRGLLSYGCYTVIILCTCDDVIMGMDCLKDQRYIAGFREVESHRIRDADPVSRCRTLL